MTVHLLFTNIIVGNLRFTKKHAKYRNGTSDLSDGRNCGGSCGGGPSVAFCCAPTVVHRTRIVAALFLLYDERPGA